MMKKNWINSVTLSNFLAMSLLSFNVAAYTTGKAYDIWVKPDGDGEYNINSSVGGGTAPIRAGNSEEILKAICQAANNNGNPLPPGEHASGGTKVHPPKAHVPAVPPGPNGPGQPESWASTPVASLSDCCKQNSKGDWEPKKNPSSTCTEGAEGEVKKIEDGKDPLRLFEL